MGVVVLVGAGALIGAGFIRRLSTKVVLSNKHVLIKSGLINRRSIEVVFQKVESIGVDESALGRLLGYGGAILRGTGGTFEKVGTIPIRTSLGGRSSNK